MTVSPHDWQTDPTLCEPTPAHTDPKSIFIYCRGWKYTVHGKTCHAVPARIVISCILVSELNLPYDSTKTMKKGTFKFK